MTARLPRVMRSGAFAALCVALAACAHVSMSSAELPAAWLALAFAGVAACSWVPTARRRSLPAVCLWMTGLQVALHQLFERVGATEGITGSRTPGPDWASLLLCEPVRASTAAESEALARAAGLDPGMTVQIHGVHGTSSITPSMEGMPGMAGMHGMPGAGMAHGASAGMLAAHALAAVACAVLFCRGDAAMAGVLRLFLLLAGGVVPLLLLLRPPAARPPVLRRPALRDEHPGEPVLLHVLVRRGPPVTAPI